MPIELRVESGPHVGEQWLFWGDAVVKCGANLFSDVPLTDDEYLSSHHFELQLDSKARHWRCRDLESRNGTYVNASRLGGRNATLRKGTRQHDDNDIIVQSGDQIIVGISALSVRIVDPLKNFPVSALNTMSDYHVCLSSSSQKVSAIEANEASERTLDILSFLEEASDSFEKCESEEILCSFKIPGYRILSMIGQGGMGAVYKALDVCSGREVAIKTILPELTASENAVNRFKREIEILSSVTHPKIARIEAHGKQNKVFYFVMEYLSDGNLFDLVAARGGRISVEAALPLMLSSLDALAHLHSKSYVHRDLKPENILLCLRDEPDVRLSDFGLSKALESVGLGGTLTRTGQQMGTATFWSREHIVQYKHFRPTTDLFEISAVYYWALTGEMIRPGIQRLENELSNAKIRPSLSHYAHAILENPIEFCAVFLKLPEPLQEVFRRALYEIDLQRFPGESGERWAIRTEAALNAVRPKTASEFKGMLIEAARQSGIEQCLNSESAVGVAQQFE